jgi:large subunit ribosomal protein L15
MAKRRGFTNRWKVEYHAVNIKALEAFESGATVNLDSLRNAGLVKGKDTLVKILGDGELSRPLHFVDLKVTASARQKIEAAGGSVSGVEPPPARHIADEPTAAEAAAAEPIPAEPVDAESVAGEPVATAEAVPEPDGTESAKEETSGQ